ncbi:MAG: hypothetical protein F6K00_28630 [Leptolyngbya sp. SIOISBB]|nr:hypothetical protein [Leptolyngbya sp. SIOISBB]
MGKYALLIGVGKYGEGLDSLPTAPNDVAALQDVLSNPDIGGFDGVKPVVNPSQRVMAQEIQEWFHNREPEDLVVLFFSGHGIKDESRRLHFAACDTNKSLLSLTAVPATFIHNCICKCKAKRQLVILDCCFSGAFGDMVAKDDGSVDIKKELGAEGRVVLTSTSSVDYSFAATDSDLSIYTRYLIEGIASGAADEDGDGIISVDELHRFAGRKVKAVSPAMSPKIIALKDEGYRIQLARSPKDDPHLKYRKEAEKRAKTGKFSIPAKRLLNSLRRDLGISESDAEVIEAEVLKPFQEYQRKLQEYRSTITASLADEEELSDDTINDLVDYRKYLALKPQDAAAIEQEMLDSELDPVYPPPPPPKNPPPVVTNKELIECEPSRILFLKNIKDPQGGWSYTLDHIRDMGGDVESRVFEIYWTPDGRGAKSASKGDLMILNQHAKLTHVVEMLDDDVRENEAGYFRWVRIVWIADMHDWSKLPHQKDILEFVPPNIGGGTAYTLANMSKLQATWESFEAFQKHVFQVLTRTEAEQRGEAIDIELKSEQGVDYSHLQELLRTGQWKDADEETYKVMLQAAGKDAEERGYLKLEEVRNFPCKDLQTIDQLWVHFSGGKFGLSVQKQIWVEVGGKLDFGEGQQAAIAAYEKMSDRNGWRVNRNYISYRQVTFDTSAPVGHLPLVVY